MTHQTSNHPDSLELNILRYAPFGVFVFKPNINSEGNYSFKLISANQTAQKQFDFNIKGDIDLFISSLFPDTVVTEIYKTSVEVLKSGKAVSKIHMLKFEKGTVQVNLQFRNHDEYLLIFTHELTDDQNDFGAQAEEEIKYRELFESSLDPIFLAVDNFNITGVNPKFCELFGYDENDVSKLVLADLFKRKTDYLIFTERLFNRKFVEEYETELLTAEGEVRYCVINTVAVLDENQKLLMYQGVIRDLTSRRETEQQLMIAEKLTMTGKLARSIAHEVRNPLTNIFLALDQFKEELSDETEDANFFLDLIKRNADRISNLVTDLMNASKQKSLELDQYIVNDILNETIDLIQDRLKLKEIELETNLSEDLPIVYLDKNQVKIAFLNVFLNAVEAMQPGKGLLKIKTSLKNKNIILEISDNGKGIAEEELANLFEPFYTGRKDGSGLGLTTTSNIIHAHKGSIRVSSKVGIGTTFTIAFSTLVKPDQINTNKKV